MCINKINTKFITDQSFDTNNFRAQFEYTYKSIEIKWIHKEYKNYHAIVKFTPEFFIVNWPLDFAKVKYHWYLVNQQINR